RQARPRERRPSAPVPHDRSTTFAASPSPCVPKGAPGRAFRRAGRRSLMARDEMAVARLAAGRRRIVTGAELEQAGMTRSAVRHWVARGRLQRVHRGVYLVGPGPLDLEQREIAAVAAYGRGTVLAEASAARR